MHCRLSRMLPNPAWPVWVLLLVAATAGMAAVSDVNIRARVETIAHVEGPAAIELAPGESRAVSVRIASNVPWQLNVAAGNPAIRAQAAIHQGGRGGFSTSGNTLEIVFSCEPSATGAQSGSIIYSITRS